MLLSDLCADCFHKAAEELIAAFPDGRFITKDYAIGPRNKMDDFAAGLNANDLAGDGDND